MKATLAKPIRALRIEQEDYYTQIYLEETLLFSIHHFAEEYADMEEKLSGKVKFHITELGLTDTIIRNGKRSFKTRKMAISACLYALRDFRAGLRQLDL